MQDNKLVQAHLDNGDHRAAIQEKAWQDSIPKQGDNAAATGQPGMAAMVEAKRKLMGCKTP